MVDFDRVAQLLGIYEKAQTLGPAFVNIGRAAGEELKEIEHELSQASKQAALQASAPVVNPSGLPKEPSVPVDPEEHASDEDAIDVNEIEGEVEDSDLPLGSPNPPQMDADTAKAHEDESRRQGQTELQPQQVQKRSL